MNQEPCTECPAPATLVRTTQFAGDHYYCDYHAQHETDCNEFIAVGVLTERRAAAELLRANQSVKLDPMPQRRGKSKQDFGTPKALLEAVEKRFGPIGWDLAAHTANAVIGRTDVPIDSLAYDKRHFDEKDNSLSQDWGKLGMMRGAVAWLNPPFANLAPWAQKCSEVRCTAHWTLMLCPASMGSKWWAEHVLGKAMVFGIPRVQFVGADSIYPKDLALLAYGFGACGHSYWDWRAE